MNYNDLLLLGGVQHGKFSDCDEWALQKIDPVKQSKLNQVYSFYDKFKLTELGFIKAELVNKNSELFLKFKRYVTSYPNEWSLSMIKDAILFHLRLFERLYSLDLALKSSSLQNIIFDYNEPLFTCLEALAIRDEETMLPVGVGDNQLQSVVVRLLIGIEFLKTKKYQELREILGEERLFFIKKKIAKIFLQHPVSMILLERSIKFHEKELSAKKTFVDQCEYLSNLVMSIDLGAEAYEAKSESIDLLSPLATQSQSLKQDSISRIISEYCPSTVLDIGAKNGQFSFLAAKQGAKVISVDQDERLVDFIYNQSKRLNLKILSLIMPFKAISYRVSCDLVLCLDLLPKLITEQKMQLDDIFKILKEATRHILVLEFLESDSLNTSIDFEYTLDNTVKVGLKYFSKITVLDSDSTKNRLLVFEK